MCVRKIFIAHRCGHRVTELVEPCETFECGTVVDTPVISNKYTCVLSMCCWFGQF